MQSLYKDKFKELLKDRWNEEKGSIEYCSDHFRRRLRERYNIIISHEEYLEINELKKRKQWRLLYFKSSMKKIGIINIQSMDVLVVLDCWRGIFITCLIRDDLYPLPNSIYKLGISREQFNEDLKEVIKDVVHLAEWLKSHPNEKTFFFKHKPFNKPEWMYRSAYGMIKLNDFIHPNKTIIDNLYEQR